MRVARDAGEPLSRRRPDRRSADARALRATAALGALVVGAVLVNGILVLLFVAIMEAVGLWVPAAAEGADLLAERGEELRANLRLLAEGRQPTAR